MAFSMSPFANDLFVGGKFPIAQTEDAEFIIHATWSHISQEKFAGYLGGPQPTQHHPLPHDPGLGQPVYPPQHHGTGYPQQGYTQGQHHNHGPPDFNQTGFGGTQGPNFRMRPAYASQLSHQHQGGYESLPNQHQKLSQTGSVFMPSHLTTGDPDGAPSPFGWKSVQLDRYDQG